MKKATLFVPEKGGSGWDECKGLGGESCGKRGKRAKMRFPFLVWAAEQMVIIFATI